MASFLFSAEHARVRTIVGWVASAIPAGMLLMASAFKFMQVLEVIAGFTKLGIIDYIVVIPILSTTSAILYLIPKTALWGLLLGTGYFGGAILSHLIGHDGGQTTVIALALLMSLGYALRNPAFAALLLGRKLDV